MTVRETLSVGLKAGSTKQSGFVRSRSSHMHVRTSSENNVPTRSKYERLAVCLLIVSQKDISTSTNCSRYETNV